MNLLFSLLFIDELQQIKYTLTMSKSQITPTQLASYVKKQAQKLMEAEAFSTEGEPTDVTMNKMVDGAKSKPEAKVKNVGGKQEIKSAKVAAADPTEVKMNTMDKEQGSDGKAAAAVKVDAKGDMGSDQSTNVGMKKADFDSKTAQPSKDSGEPFDEKGEAKMNSMDEENDEGTKTYVGAKGDMGSDQATNVGMKKPDVHEDAQNEKTPEAIAKAIEMPKEGFTFSTKAELMEWTRQQAKKIAELL